MHQADGSSPQDGLSFAVPFRNGSYSQARHRAFYFGMCCEVAERHFAVHSHAGLLGKASFPPLNSAPASKPLQDLAVLAVNSGSPSLFRFHAELRVNRAASIEGECLPSHCTEAAGCFFRQTLETLIGVGMEGERSSGSHHQFRIRSASFRCDVATVATIMRLWCDRGATVVLP